MIVFRLQGTEQGDGKGSTCHSGRKAEGPQARCGPETRGEEGRVQHQRDRENGGASYSFSRTSGASCVRHCPPFGEGDRQ